MTVNFVGISTYAHSIASADSKGEIKSSGITSLRSHSGIDSAQISDAAKELAAQNAGQNSQEEATESIGEKLQELVSGKD